MMRDIFLTLAVMLSLAAIAACEDDGLGIGVGGDTGLSGIDDGSFDRPGPGYYSSIMDNSMSRGIVDKEPFSPMDRTDSFRSSDDKAYSWLDLGTLRGPHQIEWRWHSPDGGLYFTDSSWVDGNGKDHKTAYSSIGIRGSKAESMHGNWHVDVYQDGRQMVSQRFKVAPDYSSFEGAPDGFQEFSSYYGDCAARPPGTYCLVFSDYYTYLAHDSVTDGVWAEAGSWNGRTIEVIYGVNADYYHILYTPLLKIVPKAAPGYGAYGASDIASGYEPGYASASGSYPEGSCDCNAVDGYRMGDQASGSWDDRSMSGASGGCGCQGACGCQDMGMKKGIDGSGSWKHDGATIEGIGCNDKEAGCSGGSSCEGSYSGQSMHSKGHSSDKCSE